jgi:PPOX class probable F420-dependent enzyme
MGRSASVAELPRWASGLLEEARVARLGLTDDRGYPRVLPVTYAVAGSRVVSAIDHKQKQVSGERLARVRWLRVRPRAALTVDRYDEDWSTLAWVQALGLVRVIDAAEAGSALAALAERYEQYCERPPSGPVLVLEPERLLWWRASPADTSSGGG